MPNATACHAVTENDQQKPYKTARSLRLCEEDDTVDGQCSTQESPNIRTVPKLKVRNTYISSMDTSYGYRKNPPPKIAGYNAQYLKCLVKEWAFCPVAILIGTFAAASPPQEMFAGLTNVFRFQQSWKWNIVCLETKLIFQCHVSFQVCFFFITAVYPSYHLHGTCRESPKNRFQAERMKSLRELISNFHDDGRINEPRKIPSYFPLYWLVNRDPYNGLL